MPGRGCCIGHVLATCCPDIEGGVLLGYAVGEVLDGNVPRVTGFRFYCYVCERIVGEPGLNRLIDVEHVDFVVPRPRIQVGRVGIFVHEAGPILGQCTVERRSTRTPVKPDGQGSIFGVLASFEEPKEGVDGIRLVFVWLVQGVWGKVYISCVRFYAWCGLTDVRLEEQ